MPSPAERMAKNIVDHVFFEKIGWSLSKRTILAYVFKIKKCVWSILFGACCLFYVQVP